MEQSDFCCSAGLLAMATVPKQTWCEPYDLCTALKEGTIFPCLNMPFFKAQECCSTAECCCKNADATQQAREKAMSRIMEVSFALNDLTLYLDTHPGCTSGLTLFYELSEERVRLLAEYASRYYPLTQLSMVTGECSREEYGWGEGQMPWEGACV